MDYEKKYREAMGRAKKYMEDGRMTPTNTFAEYIFPELKESEDEKIMKALVRFHKSTIDVDGIKGEYILAWLEKQGEQKPIMNVPSREVILSIWDLGNEWKELTNGSISTEYGTQLDYIQKHWHESEYYLREKQGEKKATDKVEPKFEKGQWIVWKSQYYKVNDNGCGYELIDQNGLKTSLEYSTVDENAHIFTTQDAKPGDVLYSLDSKQPFIFKHRKPNEQAAAYCGLNIYDKFFVWGTKDCVITTDKYIPSTKEQCDTLFKAIKEAGYEWDAEKKELKKLTQSVTKISEQETKSYKDAEEASAEYRKFREDCGIKDPVMLDEIEEAYYNGATSIQKPAWSEEDEEYMRDVIAFLEDARDCRQNALDCIEWMKQLKERLS